MSLKIELDVDHTRFRVETLEGLTISIPISEAGASQIKRLLLAQKAQELRDSQRPDGVAVAQSAWWREHGVGSQVAPTQQEIDHNLSHDPRFPKDTCPFCRLILAARAKAKVEPLSESDLMELLT